MKRMLYIALFILFALANYSDAKADTSLIEYIDRAFFEPEIALKPQYPSYWQHPWDLNYPYGFLVTNYHIPCDIVLVNSNNGYVPSESGNCGGFSYNGGDWSMYTELAEGQPSYCGAMHDPNNPQEDGTLRIILIVCDRTWPYMTETPVDENNVIYPHGRPNDCLINVQGATEAYVVCVQSEDRVTVIYRTSSERSYAVFYFQHDELQNLPSSGDDAHLTQIYNLDGENCQVNLLPLEGMSVDEDNNLVIPVDCIDLVTPR